MIKVGQTYIQHTKNFNEHGDEVGFVGQKAKIIEVGKRGLRFVSFIRLDNNKKVIGQYRVENFLNYFKLA